MKFISEEPGGEACIICYNPDLAVKVPFAYVCIYIYIYVSIYF